MEKLKPPSPEVTIAAGTSPSKAAINKTYEGKFKVNEAYEGKYEDNKAYEADEVMKQLPTAPPIGRDASERIPLLTLVKLSDDELREALYKYASNFCCYGSRFIKDMILTDIYDDSAFHYKLETFGEQRETGPKFTPYYGQSIDGIENGPAPDPWHVPADIPVKFLDQMITTEIPHTAHVETCSTCNGEKKVICSSCSGRGKRTCSSCRGWGRDSDRERCFSCSGSGTTSCYTCSSTGKVKCSTCDGHGKVKWYTQLTVTWKNHVDHFVSNRELLQKDLVMEASGREIFNEQGDKVNSMTTAPDRIIHEASAVLIGNHKSSFTDELHIAQRHSLLAVPFTKATYIWRGKKGEFYVYDFDKKVYFEDYPQQCCCCVCC